jgi:hypothetical protein
MKQMVALLFCSFLIASCGERSKQDQRVTQPSSQDTGKKVVLDTFSIFPTEVEGCSCYFSNNKEEFKNRRYIYVDNYDSSAYIKINGLFKRFTLLEEKEVGPNHYIKRFKDGNLELTLDIEQVGQVDETWQQKGTLRISSVKGGGFTKDIYGECGC